MNGQENFEQIAKEAFETNLESVKRYRVGYNGSNEQSDQESRVSNRVNDLMMTRFLKES